MMMTAEFDLALGLGPVSDLSGSSSPFDLSSYRPACTPEDILECLCRGTESLALVRGSDEGGVGDRVARFLPLRSVAVPSRGSDEEREGRRLREDERQDGQASVSFVQFLRDSSSKPVRAIPSQKR